MKKIEIDKDKLLATAKKTLPWVIGGGLIIAGGVFAYKRGFLKGVNTGMHSGVELTIKEITDHLGESVSHFCMYNNSNNIPVILKGVAVATEADIPAAAKLVEFGQTESNVEKVTEELTKIIFKKN